MIPESLHRSYSHGRPRRPDHLNLPHVHGPTCTLSPPEHGPTLLATCTNSAMLYLSTSPASPPLLGGLSCRSKLHPAVLLTATVCSWPRAPCRGSAPEDRRLAA